MRSRRSIATSVILVVTATAAACTAYTPAPGPPLPRVSAEVALFYDSLLPYGDWLWIDAHGWVWTPYGVTVDWRPYTYGRWVYTHHGWTWVSDWPWGWAPFHYGRWTRHPGLGWVWIPGDLWGPAWVAWRYGPGWVGWAPLPPGARWRVGVGLDLGGVVIDFGWWSFVPTGHFVDRRLRPHIVPGATVPHLARTTRPVTRYEDGERGVIERSVPIETIERETRRAVPRLRVEETPQPPGRRSSPIAGDRLRVHRPQAGDGTTEARPRERGPAEKERGESGAGRTRPPRRPDVR